MYNLIAKDFFVGWRQINARVAAPSYSMHAPHYAKVAANRDATYGTIEDQKRKEGHACIRERGPGGGSRVLFDLLRKTAERVTKLPSGVGWPVGRTFLWPGGHNLHIITSGST